MVRSAESLPYVVCHLTALVGAALATYSLGVLLGSPAYDALSAGTTVLIGLGGGSLGVLLVAWSLRAIYVEASH